MNASGPSDETVGALARQLFRVENPPDLLWDETLHERAGLPTDGYRFASAELRALYETRARDMPAGTPK